MRLRPLSLWQFVKVAAGNDTDPRMEGKPEEGENTDEVPAGAAQWIECQPVNRRVAGSIPIGAHAWVAGQVPSRGQCERQPHIDIFKNK